MPMKGKLKFVLLLSWAALIASCTKTNTDAGLSAVSQDSTSVAQQIESQLDPSFTTVTDVLTYQLDKIEEWKIDDIFFSLPQETLTNVATVCLRKLSAVTITDIVMEYLNNRAVYDNLHTESESTLPLETETTPTAMEEQSTLSDSLSYRYQMDTINGRAVIVKIEEKRTVYE